jgi:hypothetical protein
LCITPDREFPRSHRITTPSDSPATDSESGRGAMGCRFHRSSCPRSPIDNVLIGTRHGLRDTTGTYGVLLPTQARKLLLHNRISDENGVYRGCDRAAYCFAAAPPEITNIRAPSKRAPADSAPPPQGSHFFAVSLSDNGAPPSWHFCQGTSCTDIFSRRGQPVR